VVSQRNRAILIKSLPISCYPICVPTASFLPIDLYMTYTWALNMGFMGRLEASRKVEFPRSYLSKAKPL